MHHFHHLFALALCLISSAKCQLYTLRTCFPGHPLDGKAIDARGQGFYTGLSGPSTYCPTIVNPNCPENPQKGTIFAGIMGLWVMVPGGQQTYVNPNGAIGFTQAHSGSVPSGSYREGWKYISSNTAPFRNLITWEAPDKSTRGVYACLSSPASATRPTSYQIFAKTPAFARTDCVELDGLDPVYLPDNTPIAVWQYA